MCSVFQVRIASIIPTTYNAKVAVRTGVKHQQWPLHDRAEFKKVVDAQMKSLAQEWKRVSSLSVQVVHLPEQVDTEVTELQRRGKDQPLDEKQHEITKPSLKTLINEACASDGRLRDAMVYYIWIVFPLNIYDELTGQQKKGHYSLGSNRIWVPCLEVKLLEQGQDEQSEDRVGHEFKEWLVDTVRTVDTDAFGKHEVDEKKLSNEDVMSRLSRDILAKLHRKFGYRPDWLEQGDNIGA